MEPHTPTVVTLALAKLLVAAMFAALHRSRPERSLVWWSAAWSLDGARHLLPLLLPLPDVVSLPLAGSMLIGGSYALLVGTLHWVGRPVGRAWLGVAAVCAAALGALTAAGVDHEALWPISGGFLALTRGRSGVAIARGPGSPILRAAASGGLLLLAALALLYPWFAQGPERLSWGFVTVTILVVTVGFALMLLYLDRLREGVELQQRQLRSVFEGSGQNIAVYDGDGRILRINPSFAALIDRSAGDFIDDALVPSSSDRRAFFRASDFSSRPVQRVRLQTAAAGVRDFDISVSRLPEERLYMVFAYDVSKQVALEHELEQARRLEALGRVASGIAHDFNNVLNVISTYLSLGRLSNNPDDALAGIREATRRGQRVTQKLSAVGPRRQVQLQTLRVDRAIRDMATWLDDLMAEDTELRMAVDDDPGMIVRADVGQIEQLLFNLVSNARAASPDGQPVELTATVVRASAPRVRIEVADRGPGVPPEIRERVFDPFFSTREGAAGLGLTAVQSIVEDRGWKLEILDRAGGGAVFRVDMPATEPERPADAAERPRASTEPKGSFQILLLDDNATLIGLVAQALQHHGHRATTWTDPRDALAELQRTDYDVLVTDVDMPAMSGLEVRDRAWETNPDLVVILVSGYTIGDIESDPRQVLLSKPFATEDLLRHIRSRLEARDGDGE